MSPQTEVYYCDLLGEFFTIFAHATRMRICCALQHGPKTVTEIANYADISITNASQHLRLMRDKGAVESEKRKQSVFYRIADRRFLHAANLIREALIEQMQDKARIRDTGFANFSMQPTPSPVDLGLQTNHEPEPLSKEHIRDH